MNEYTVVVNLQVTAIMHGGDAMELLLQGGSVPEGVRAQTKDALEADDVTVLDYKYFITKEDENG